MNDTVELTDNQRQFHLEEFKKLSVEVAEIVKSLQNIFTFAAIASGGLFAWLLTSGAARGPFTCPEPTLKFGLWIPLGLSIALVGITYALAIRIHQMGSYLSRLERYLGSPQLGWQEHFSKHDAVVARAGWIAWAVLLVGNLLVPAGVGIACAV